MNSCAANESCVCPSSLWLGSMRTLEFLTSQASHGRGHAAELMAIQWLLFLLLPLLLVLGSRVALPARAPGAATRQGAAVALAEDVVWQVLRLVPGPGFMAWCRAGDVRAVRVVRQGREHRDWVLGGLVRSTRFWPTGDRFVTSAKANTTVWHVRKRRPVWMLPRRFEGDMRILPAGDRVAAFAGPNEWFLWDTASGDLERLSALAADTWSGIRVLNESRLATGSWRGDGRAYIWDVPAGSVWRELRMPCRGQLRLLEASPCGSKLLTTSREGVFLWDVETASLQLQLHTSGHVCDHAAVSHEGARIVVCAEGHIFVWDGVTGELRRRFAVGAGKEAIALLQQGRRVAAINASEAAMWDVESGERLPLGVSCRVCLRVAICVEFGVSGWRVSIGQQARGGRQETSVGLF